MKFDTKPLNFGGKANRLIELDRRGMLVPKSKFFDLSDVFAHLLQVVPEYETWIARVALWEVSDEWLEAGSAPEELEWIRQGILSAQAPRDWWFRVKKMKEDLGELVMVRSSVNLEDSESASFAGCFQSLRVNLNQSENLWQAILEVISSVYETSSMVRILESGFDLRKLRPGFFIQSYIHGRVSGVCFSHSPGQLREGAGCVEWAADAESVVQGVVPTQISYQFENPPHELKSCWSELWRNMKDILGILQSPVDVEWSWDGERVILLQARPIATPEARLIAQSMRRGGVKKIWSREQTQERFPEALTPLGWSALEDVFATNLQVLEEDFGIQVRNPEEVGICIGGYVYADPQVFQFPSGIKVHVGKYLKPWTQTPWKVAYLLAQHVGQKLVERIRGQSSPISNALFQLSLFDALLSKLTQRVVSSWDVHRDECLRQINEFQSSRLFDDPQRPDQILRLMEDLRGISIQFMRPDLSIYLLKEILFRSLKKLWIDAGLSEVDFPHLVSGFDGNRTTQMHQELHSLVLLLSSDCEAELFLNKLRVAKSWKEGLEAANHLSANTAQSWADFLKKNGHCRTSWDVALPSWRELPSQLEPVIRALIVNQKSPSESQEIRSKQMRARARLALEQALVGLGQESKIPKIQEDLNRLEALMRMDEEQHFLSGILLEPSRALIFRAYDFLEKKGVVLKDKNDVFFLTLEELKQSLVSPSQTLRLLMRKRRSEWLRNKKNIHPLEYRVGEASTHPVTDSSQSVSGSALKGLAVSPGQAVGRVYRLEHLWEADQLEPGSILLTTAPNPSFVPLYPLLGGVISMTGGPLSHGFVAAREQGLPAVSGIADADLKLLPGALVRVDGSSGWVEVL